MSLCDLKERKLYHLVIECVRNNDIRNQYLCSIVNFGTRRDNWIYLLNNPHEEIVKAITYFIINALKRNNNL